MKFNPIPLVPSPNPLPFTITLLPLHDIGWLRGVFLWMGQLHVITFIILGIPSPTWACLFSWGLKWNKIWVKSRGKEEGVIGKSTEWQKSYASLFCHLVLFRRTFIVILCLLRVDFSVILCFYSQFRSVSFFSCYLNINTISLRPSCKPTGSISQVPRPRMCGELAQ